MKCGRVMETMMTEGVFFYGDEEVVKSNVKVEVRRWWNENNEKERRSIPLLVSVSISTWKYLSST